MTAKTAPGATVPALPAKVTATLADDDRGTRIYRIADKRGYTGREDTIRVRVKHTPEGVGGLYAVDTLRRDGWTDLLDGTMHKGDPLPYGDAIRRAVAILFGMEEHG
jgi:hypothetical protein